MITEKWTQSRLKPKSWESDWRKYKPEDWALSDLFLADDPFTLWTLTLPAIEHYREPVSFETERKTRIQTDLAQPAFALV